MVLNGRKGCVGRFRLLIYSFALWIMSLRGGWRFEKYSHNSVRVLFMMLLKAGLLRLLFSWKYLLQTRSVLLSSRDGSFMRIQLEKI